MPASQRTAFDSFRDFVNALHVAAAVPGNFKTFVSFDPRSYPRVLAAAQKLKVWPPLTAEENQFLK